MAINSNPGQTSTGGPSQLSRPNQPGTVSDVPGLEHNGEHGLEFLIPKPAFERAFADFGGSKVIVPALIKERLAVAENPLIPSPIAQNRWAQSRRPMDMMSQGRSVSLFHASQQ